MNPGVLGQRVRSAVHYLVFVYGSEWKYLAAVLGVALTVLGLTLPPEIVVPLTVGGTLFTLALFAYETWEVYFRWRGIALEEAGPYAPADFAGAQWRDGAAGRDRRFDAVVIGDHHAWVDLDVNRALADGPAVKAYALPNRFVLPPELQEVSARVLHQTARDARRKAATRRLEDRSARRPIRFNGRLARLATEPTVDTVRRGSLGLQFVTYYDGECSNELWSRTDPVSATRDAERTGRPVPTHPPRLAAPFVIDDDRAILSLADARVANIVGITVLAITSEPGDGEPRILFIRQSAANNVEPGFFVASASGSLDWADTGFARPGSRSFRRRTRPTAPKSFHEIVMTGMLRELHEESGVERARVVPGTDRLTGYFRWLERGAKPEFAGLVRVSGPASATVDTRIGGAESAYTHDRLSVPLSALRATAALGAERIWTDPSAVDPLRLALAEATGTGPEQVRIGGSSTAAWLAAGAFLSEHPEWLARPHDQ